MTHPTLVTNGASLEDCHTNFFALADLCGLKWRRLSSEQQGPSLGGGGPHRGGGGGAADPLSEPVLSSFAKCLAADLLCVWRRVARPELPHRRELWVFWYGEEPDLAGLVSPELNDTEQGSWENGLSYECRSLLFKALHNLIQRCLLSRGFTRLGKWFLQPCDTSEKDRGAPSVGGASGPQLTFAFHFFVHGDSTVCASVDVRQHPAIYRLSRHHLLQTQAGTHTATKVILGPFGLAGTLTGQGYKETDAATQTLLSEWHQFFPLPPHASAMPQRGDATPPGGDEELLPCAVEVLVGGVKLRYPSAYVFVVETDEPAGRQETPPVAPNLATPAPNPGAPLGGPHLPRGGPPGYPGGMKLPPGLTGVLTPPTSPRDPGYFHHGGGAHPRGAGQVAAAGGPGPPGRPACPPAPPPSSTVPADGPPVAVVAHKTKGAAWQDGLLSRGPCEDEPGGWDFVEPCGQTHCFCYRCHRNKPRPTTPGPAAACAASSGTPLCPSGPPQGSSGAQAAPSPSAKKSSSDKGSGRPRGPPATPFHRRSPVPGGAAPFVDYESIALPPAAGKLPQPQGGAGSLLPQLHTQQGPPPSVGSCSHPGTPLLLSEGGGPASQASQADPAMPTLSPHPPPREEGPAAPRPSPAPQDAGGATGASPAPPQGDAAKDRPPGEQLLSPSSLLDVKPPLEAPPSCSPGGGSHQWGGPGSCSSAAATPAAPCGLPAPSSASSVGPGEDVPGTPGGTGATGGSSPSGGAPSTPAAAAPGTPAPPARPASSTAPVAPPTGVKRPCLPTIAHEALVEAETPPMGSRLLYDYSSVYPPPWEVPPCKRPHLGAAPRRPNAGDVCGPYSSQPYRRVEVEPPCEPQQSAPLAPGGSRDPYEFHEDCDDDTAGPAATAARAALQGTPGQPALLVPKEEDKEGVPMDTSGQELGSAATPNSGTGGSATPVPECGAVLPGSKEGSKEGAPRGGSLAGSATPGSTGDLPGVGSPPTPRHPGFTRVEDLKVTDCDLENIFDTSSSDESSDDPFQAPSTPSSTKPAGASDEPPGKSKNSTTAGILGAAELTRMFPTPPSLEHNAAPSPSGPVGVPDLLMGDGSDPFYTKGMDPYCNYGSPGFEAVRDWSYVFKPPMVHQFLSSRRYAPLGQLPSATLPPLPALECAYKPSWQRDGGAGGQAPQGSPAGVPLQGQRHLPHYHPAVHHPPTPAGPSPVGPMASQQHMMPQEAFLRMGGHVMAGAGLHPSLLDRHPSHHQPGMDERVPYPGMLDHPSQLGPMGGPPMMGGYELGPYAANGPLGPLGAAAYMGPHGGRHLALPHQGMHPLHSQQQALGPAEGGGASLPEADSLLVNLLLSDSLLELFRDHNFSSCTLCVCNMNIKGADVGVYLPASLVPTASEEPQYKCTCGFSAVVNRHHSHRTGLFYQDEQDVTGIPYEATPGPHRAQGGAGGGSQLPHRGPGGPLANGSLQLPKVHEEGLLEYVQSQCLGMALSPCSVLHKTLQLGAERQHDLGASPVVTGLLQVPPQLRGQGQSSLLQRQNLHHRQGPLALLPALDGCEVTLGALEAAASRPLDEPLGSPCLHRWPYLHCPCPPSSLVSVGLLRGLQPLLQDAVHKKRNQGLWEVTYRVAGPLTWRQFHRLAGRGTEDQCEPQPIPSLLVGYDRDWLALSPFALKYWDKLLLEPYSPARDVAYVVVAPDSEPVLSSVRAFFQDLSATYQALNLGRHCPLSRGGLREGLLRVSAQGPPPETPGGTNAEDDWFAGLGEGPLGTRLRLFARACRMQLGPHLASQSLDRGLLEGPPGAPKSGDSKAPLASPRPPPTPEGAGSAGQQEGSSTRDGGTTPRPQADSESSQDACGASSTTAPGNPSQGASVGAPAGLGASAGPTSTGGASSAGGAASAPGGAEEGEEEQQPPALVVYLVEPFTLGSSDPEVLRLATVGLHRCFAQLLDCLPEPLQSNTHAQILSLDSILGAGGRSAEGFRRQEQLRALSLSVFYQCARLLVHQSSVKSLTGFGPAAAQDDFLKARAGGNAPVKVWSPPFVLAPQKDKQTELGEMFGDRREKSGILFCAYCLTEDQRWLLASVSNDKGDLLDNCSINIEIPNRTRRKKACARRLGLHKLLDWLLGVAACGPRGAGAITQPWRLVVGRLGRVGHGELKEWAALLGRRSLLRYSRRLRELCHQCAAGGASSAAGGGAGAPGVGGPCVLSACLVSLEPDGALRLFHDRYTPDERFSSACHSCDLSTPQDASATHILVFPTSATTQSSQATFQQDHMDPLSTTLGDDDEIFKSLTEDIAVGNDFNDILNWTDSPEAPCSPTRRSSPPGSPGAMMGGGPGGRQSPFQHGGTLRGPGSGGADAQEEPMQLLQQPLALGYYVSTAPTGSLPRWFWASCPHLRESCPVFLKSALLLHCPTVHQNHDDLLHGNPHLRNYHPLDSTLTTDVLRYVLEGYNTLSWLSLDPHSHDRQSCLPLHMQNLMKLYHAVEALL